MEKKTSDPIRVGGPLSPLPTTTPSQQFVRQRISNSWEPNGFARYAYQRELLKGMNILGGPGDEFGANPDRYLPTGPLC